MRLTVLASLVAGIALGAAPVGADVRITIANGAVTVSATDATPRQILAEWARVGQTRIVNIERIGGVPMSLELINVPETQALDTLLRGAGDYLAAPRAVALPNASRYDRIYVLPASTATARPAAPAQPQPQPAFRMPQQQPTFAPPDDLPDDQEPAAPQPAGPVVLPPQPGGARGPIFSTFPQPRPAQRNAPPPPAPEATPSAPAGVSRPGLVVPAATPPAQDQAGGAVRR